MKKFIYQSAIKTLRLQRNYAVLAGLGLLVLCVIQGWALLVKDTKIIALPPQINAPFWVKNNTVSDSFLSQWTRFYVALRLNKTPANAAAQSAELLKYVTPHLYAALKHQLTTEDKKIVNGAISTSFFIVSEKIFSQTRRVIVTGDFHAEVGKAVLPVHRLQYAIAYRYSAGRLYIDSFNPVKETSDEA